MRASFPVDQCADIFCEIILTKVGSRHIYRYGHALSSFIEPSSLVSGYMDKHIVIDMSNESALFEDRNELAGRNEAHVRCDPSDKCFRASELIGTRIIFRLIVNEKFFVCDRLILSLGNCIYPLLFFNKIVIEECDSRIAGVSNRKFCSTCIVVEKVNVRNKLLLVQQHFFLSGSNHIYTRLKGKIMIRRECLKGTDYFLQSCSRIILIRDLHKKRDR